MNFNISKMVYLQTVMHRLCGLPVAVLQLARVLSIRASSLSVSSPMTTVQGNHFFYLFSFFLLAITVITIGTLGFTSLFRTISTFLHVSCNVHTPLILPDQTEVPFLRLSYSQAETKGI